MKSIQETKLMVLTIGLAFCLTGQVFAGQMLLLKGGNIDPVDATRSQNKGVSLGFKTNSLRHFVVQFANHVSESDRDLLTNVGAMINTYLPEDALVVKASERAMNLAQTLMPGIRAVTPFQPEWKIDQTILKTLDSDKDRNTAEQDTLFHVRTFDQADTTSALAQLRAIPQVSVPYASHRSLVVSAPISKIGDIAEIDGVEWIQIFPLMQLFDFDVSDDTTPTPTASPSPTAPPPAPAITGYESGTRVMGFDALWVYDLYGSNQVGASADTGVDMGDVSKLHQDLGQVTKGYPMGMYNTEWADPMGHGTHVCGSVVGTGKASDSKIRGGAFKATFIAEGMWNPIFNNLIVESDFNKLMGTPYNDGARVHTNSWGSPLNPGAYDNFAAMADEIMWKNPELLVIFAAGNDGKDLDKDGRIDEGSVSTPGTAKNIISVGASENLLTEGGIQKTLCELKDGKKKWGVEPLCSDKLSNNPNGLAAFSSRGPTQDKRIKPDLVAPGTNIVSVRSQHPKAQKLWGEFSKDYLYSGGTSMAAPLVAGAALAVRQYLVEMKKIPNPSAALIKARLIHSARDLFPGQYGRGQGQELPQPRPNAHEGYGLVDLSNLVSLFGATLIDNTTGVGLGESLVVDYTVLDSHGLRATLVYTDAPASTDAAVALVNDLDLVVTAPDGAVTTLNDHTNNVEMIEISRDAPPGLYKIAVKGVNVPQGKDGKQPYALIMSSAF